MNHAEISGILPALVNPSNLTRHALKKISVDDISPLWIILARLKHNTHTFPSVDSSHKPK
jgi:hypothetical protein